MKRITTIAPLRSVPFFGPTAANDGTTTLPIHSDIPANGSVGTPTERKSVLRLTSNPTVSCGIMTYIRSNFSMWSLTMVGASVESRLDNLESQVFNLQEQLRSIRRESKDWRRTIGAFTDDSGMQGLLEEAMRLRDEDREKTRPQTDGDYDSR